MVILIILFWWLICSDCSLCWVCSVWYCIEWNVLKLFLLSRVWLVVCIRVLFSVWCFQFKVCWFSVGCILWLSRWQWQWCVCVEKCVWKFLVIGMYQCIVIECGRWVVVFSIQVCGLCIMLVLKCMIWYWLCMLVLVWLVQIICSGELVIDDRVCLRLVCMLGLFLLRFCQFLKLLLLYLMLSV